MKFLISTHFYQRRFLHPLQTGHGLWKKREGIFIKLESEEGIGIGELAPIPSFNTETVEEAQQFIDSLGREITLDKLKIPETLPCTDFAFSSAIAQLNQVQQTKSNQVFPIAGLLPSGPGAKAALASKISLGFTTFKWKIGVHSFEEEAQIFDHLIEISTPNIRFRLDANASMNEVTLGQWMYFVQKYRSQIEFFEQPLPVGQEKQMNTIAAQYGIPIALDESLNGPHGKQWFNQNAWEGLFVIKPCAFGAFAFLKDCFSKLGTRCIISSSFETSIGLEQCLELAASIKTHSFALGFDTQTAFSDDYNLNQTLSTLSLSQIRQHAKSVIAHVF